MVPHAGEDDSKAGGGGEWSALGGLSPSAALYLTAAAAAFCVPPFPLVLSVSWHVPFLQLLGA